MILPRPFLNYFLPSHHNAYRPHLLQRPWLLFFLALSLAAEGFLVSNLIARQTDEHFLAAVLQSDIISLTNDERASEHLGALTSNAGLTMAAQAKAEDMAARSYFSHTGPDGKTPWQWIQGVGYSFQYAGENLAVRFVNSSDVVHAWMESPTHRANIVKPVYTEIGVGVARGTYEGEPAVFVVQYFGTPLASASGQPNQILTQSAVSPQGGVSPGESQVKAAVAEVNASQPSSFVQTIGKQFLRAIGNPERTSTVLLSIVATLLVLVLGMTIFTHVQVQHSTMLAQGAVVAGFAIAFLILNSATVAPLRVEKGPAFVAGSLRSSAAIIDAQAASVEYAQFP